MKKRWRNNQLRKMYEEHYGKIPLGRELHHLLPWYAGGTDDWRNLVALTPEEHMAAHYARWKEMGDFRDLCAYYMIGYNFSEAHRISSSEGGKIGGMVVLKKAVGICTNDLKKRSAWASLGGKVGGKVQKKMGLGIHGASKEQNKIWASMGGKVGGFTQSELQRELGRRGGPKNKGFIWLTDGVKACKYTKKMQDEKPLDIYLLENAHLKRGGPINSRPNGRVWTNDGKCNFFVLLPRGQSIDDYLLKNTGMRKGRFRYAENKEDNQVVRETTNSGCGNS